MGIDFLCDGFVTLPPLTFTSIKAMDATLNYARFLKIGILVLYQERTVLIVSKFQFTQRIGSRPVKLKPISRSISSVSFLIIVSSGIGWPDYLHENTCNNVKKCI